MLALASLAGSVHAVEFSEAVKAPTMKSAADFKSQVEGFAKNYREVRAAAPAQLITDSSLAKRQFDLKWQLERAIDQRASLENLGEIGLVSRANGSYEIDTTAHPEWNELHETVAGMLAHTSRDTFAAALPERGFRPEDVTRLQQFIDRNDPRARSRMAKLPIALSFSRTVEKYDRAKRPVPDAVVFSYLYQSSLAASESERAWVEELLSIFDPQRQRILVSAFQEFLVVKIISPSDPAAVVAGTLAAVRLPDFEALATAEAKGVAP
jgi:hypothetical protein